MDGKELQVDGSAVAVVMADEGDPGAYGRLDAEFFVELAGKGLVRPFASLNFFAGGLPLEGHRLIRTALADQDFAAADDERSRNETKGGSGGPGGGVWLGLFHSSSVNALSDEAEAASFQRCAS